MNQAWFQGNKEWLGKLLFIHLSMRLFSRWRLFHCWKFFFSELNREVIYLGRLHHPNLVKLIGYSLEDEDRVLVYEYMPNGSLENHFV